MNVAAFARGHFSQVVDVYVGEAMGFQFAALEHQQRHLPAARSTEQLDLKLVRQGLEADCVQHTNPRIRQDVGEGRHLNELAGPRPAALEEGVDQLAHENVELR